MRFGKTKPLGTGGGEPPSDGAPIEAGVSHAELRAQLPELIRAVPAGRVISYGELGARCQPPISGYICGRLLGRGHSDLPWWRVVAKSGALPVSKRDPAIAKFQRETLESEGVRFDEEGRIKPDCFVT